MLCQRSQQREHLRRHFQHPILAAAQLCPTNFDIAELWMILLKPLKNFKTVPLCLSTVAPAGKLTYRTKKGRQVFFQPCVATRCLYCSVEFQAKAVCEERCEEAKKSIDRGIPGVVRAQILRHFFFFRCLGCPLCFPVETFPIFVSDIDDFVLRKFCRGALRR